MLTHSGITCANGMADCGGIKSIQYNSSNVYNCDWKLNCCKSKCYIYVPHANVGLGNKSIITKCCDCLNITKETFHHSLAATSWHHIIRADVVGKLTHSTSTFCGLPEMLINYVSLLCF